MKRPRYLRATFLLVALASCGYENERGAMTERTQGDAFDEQMRAGTRASPADGVAMGISSSEARFVRNLTGFAGPESAKYDPEQDAWFITNMNGAGSIKDGNGYISRISAEHPDSAIVFAQGGLNGVVLDSPKGTALHGDTLWVADISVLRAFDRHSGKPLANVDFAPLGAVQLNDVFVGPDGVIHVTDTGIIMSPKGVLHIGPDRVFTLGPGQQPSVWAADPKVTWPNGIAWDPEGKQWIVVSFDPYHGKIYSLPADASTSKVIRDGLGRLDGLEILPHGDIIFTSWADSSLHLLRNGKDRQLVREVPEPADIGYDTKRRQVAIPLSVLGRVQLWDLSGVLDKRSP